MISKGFLGVYIYIDPLTHLNISLCHEMLIMFIHTSLMLLSTMSLSAFWVYPYIPLHILFLNIYVKYIKSTTLFSTLVAETAAKAEMINICINFVLDTLLLPRPSEDWLMKLMQHALRRAQQGAASSWRRGRTTSCWTATPCCWSSGKFTIPYWLPCWL